MSPFPPRRALSTSNRTQAVLPSPSVASNCPPRRHTTPPACPREPVDCLVGVELGTPDRASGAGVLHRRRALTMQHPPTPTALATTDEPHRLTGVLRRAAGEILAGLLDGFELRHCDPYDSRVGVTCLTCRAAAVADRMSDAVGWCVDHVDGPRHHAATVA